MKIFDKLFPSREQKKRNALEIRFSDNFLWLNHPEQEGEKILWDSIDEIRAVVTNDESENLFLSIRVKFKDGHIDIPRGCKGYKDFRERIYKLKDFATPNYEQAVGCTDLQQFILWRKEKKQPSNPLKSQKTA